MYTSKHTHMHRLADRQASCTHTHLIQEFLIFLSSMVNQRKALVMTASGGHTVLLDLVAWDLDPGTILILDLEGSRGKVRVRVRVWVRVGGWR